MLISTETPVAPRVPVYAGHRRIGAKACAAIVAVMMLAALLLLGVSLFLPYETLLKQLVALYGADRTSRYFSPAVFSSAMSRLRYGAVLLLLLAGGVVGFRRILVRALDSLAGSILMSIRHARRSHGKPNWKVDPVTSLALAAIAGIGLLLRLEFLRQPMRYDEAVTVLSYASKPLYLGLSLYNEPNNHLFHTLLVHLAMKLAGTAEWAIRLPAFAAGTVLCLLAYALCRRLAGTRSGNWSALWTAALVSTSSILVEYSTNARGYTLICCATLVLLITAYETLRRGSPMWFVLFGVTTVLGFWTIPIFLIPFGGTVLWMAWESLHRHRRFRRLYWLRASLAVALAGIATIGLYLPPLAVNGPGALLKNQWVAPRNLQAFLAGNGTQLGLTWQEWNRDLPSWWPVLIALAFFCGMVIAPRVRRLLICLFAWVVFLFAARHFVPFSRNWLMFLPLCLMAAAIPFGWLAERLVSARTRAVAHAASAASAVALAALLSIPVYSQRSVLTSKDTGVLTSAKQIAAFMAAKNIAPDQVFRGSTSDMPIQYYWWRRTGAQPDKASVQALDAKGEHRAWFVLNGAYGEELDQLFVRQGLRRVEILTEEPFEGARLVEVAWQP